MNTDGHRCRKPLVGSALAPTSQARSDQGPTLQERASQTCRPAVMRVLHLDSICVHLCPSVVGSVFRVFRSFPFPPHTMSNPSIRPVEEAKLPSSIPMRWSIETNRLGSG